MILNFSASQKYPDHVTRVITTLHLWKDKDRVRTAAYDIIGKEVATPMKEESQMYIIVFYGSLHLLLFKRIL